MTEMSPEPKPTFFLRDRLLAVLSEYEVKDPPGAVEGVCGVMTQWLRVQADEWHEQGGVSGDVMGVAKGAALLCQALADGIEAGRPQQGQAPSGTDVTNQDPGVL